jgi:hypothetical protein
LQVTFLQGLQFSQKWRVFRPTIRKKAKHGVLQALVYDLQQDTAKGRNADPSSQKHRRPRPIVMKNQITEWSLHFHVCTDRHACDLPLEGCISHPGRNQKPPFIRGTRNGKRTTIAFSVRLRRVDECHVDKLSSLEGKPFRFLKLKRHGALCDITAVLQLQ